MSVDSRDPVRPNDDWSDVRLPYGRRCKNTESENSMPCLARSKSATSPSGAVTDFLVKEELGVCRRLS
jgi:hypothetical protein